MLAGGLTVISPILTATTGCLLADRLAGPTPGPRLIAQGAARMTALGGGLLLVFLPGTPRLHSSAGALLRSAYVPEPMDAVWPYALILVIGAGLACLALQPMARGLARLIQRRGQSLISGLAALCLVLIVAALAGGIGLVVLATSTGIGLIAPLFNARPVHGVGLILIPMACQVSGFGPDLANWLGWFP